MINIKMARIKRGYKQRELAELVGISRHTLAYYEQGRVNPSVKVIIRIAKTLDVTTDFLFGLTDQM